MDFSHVRVLLVGPRVVHLRTAFVRHDLAVQTASNGVDGMAALQSSGADVVLLELNLGDLTASELLMTARDKHPNTAFILVDDAARASQIVRTMQAGLDGYLAAPPADERLFAEISRHARRAARLPAPNTGSDVADLERRLGELSLENELLRQEIVSNQEVVHDFARARAEIQRLQADAERAQLPTTPGQAAFVDSDSQRIRVVELEIELAQRTEEVARLQEEVVLLKEEREALDDKHRFEIAEVSRALAQQGIQMRAQREAAEQHGAHHGAVAQQVEQLQARVEELTGAIEQERADAAARVEAARDELKRERVRLVREREDAAAGSHDAFAKIARFADESAELRRRVQFLEQELGALQTNTVPVAASPKRDVD